MSDLHEAVQAELDAHRPELVPPFAAVRARKRRREQRRAGAAVALSALAVAGVAFGSGAFGLGHGRAVDGGRTGYADGVKPSTTSTGPSAFEPVESFNVRYRNLAGQEGPPQSAPLRGCLDLPGVSAHVAGTVPPSYEVDVTGTAQARAFADCTNRLDDVATTDLGQGMPVSAPVANDAATVILTDVQPAPTVAIRVGQTVRVLLDTDYPKVTDPAARPEVVLSLVASHVDGGGAVAVFRADRAGTATLSAGVTGIPDGLNHPYYSAKVVVVPAPGPRTVSGVLRETGGPQGVSQPGVPGTVFLEGPDGRYFAQANADGKFSLNVPEGRYTATGTSRRYGDGRGVCRALASLAVGQDGLRDVEVACDRR